MNYVRVAVLAWCVLSSPELMAQNPDIEAMKRSLEVQIGVFQRLNSLEGRVTKLEQKGGDLPSTPVVTPPSSGSVVGSHSPAAEPSASKTAVCKCQGSNRGVCFCLQNRVPCKCHVSKGSVWNLNEQGRAVSKTGEYADPRGNATVARSNAPSGSAPTDCVPSVPIDDSVPQKRTDGNWWWKHPGGEWYFSARTPAEGLVFNAGSVAFVYQNGRMVVKAPEMAVVIQPSGHWERRCVGGVCRMYWIAD